mgnify:CR=1 FL=1
MPEGYIYRTTVAEMINEQNEIVQKHEADLDELEKQLGCTVEMHIRTLKNELRCARTLLDDQVN